MLIWIQIIVSTMVVGRFSFKDLKFSPSLSSDNWGATLIKFLFFQGVIYLLGMRFLDVGRIKMETTKHLLLSNLGSGKNDLGLFRMT